MPDQSPSSRRSRADSCFVTGGILLALLLVGGLFWAKYNITTIKKWRGGNAWSLTYQATAVSGDPRATGVVYRHNPDSFKKESRDERLGATTLPWRTEVIVNTGAVARLEVTPSGDGEVACRILLDGVRPVAEGSSPAPGKPAVCQVTTSDTPEKWPTGPS
ncbi:hypothetical protein ACFOSC_08250 [Streptantibioticus rubrisoli]|uniref:Uncharacterized protein n=1 Tax=Streptantibioticus rubrisoli TaxID=1387313 RepID=A0ABT1P7J6_9ACTN|nr:hypothetical protein [Streptantibioticus rubrisoli]MCQ4041349.1 hypothetical protein [Streptantibioticus rubrisoli]